jgi:hypothetical protein
MGIAKLALGEDTTIGAPDDIFRTMLASAGAFVRPRGMNFIMVRTTAGTANGADGFLSMAKSARVAGECDRIEILGP